MFGRLHYHTHDPLSYVILPKSGSYFVLSPKYNSPEKGDGNHAAIASVLSHLAITLATDLVDH